MVLSLLSMGVAIVFIRMTIVIIFYTEYIALLPTKRISTERENGDKNSKEK